MITTQQKQQISQALNTYIDDYGMSANEIVKRSGVNESYVSSIRNGETTVGKSDIKDKWYLMLANFIGLRLEKEHIPMIETAQILKAMEVFEDARENGVLRTLIGDTGSGKTYFTDAFKMNFPVDTYVIKIKKVMSLMDLIDKLAQVLNITTGKTKSKKVDDIISRLKTLRLEGQKPTVVFDESEFMSQPTVNTVKDLIDELVGTTGLIIIGTSQFLEKVEKARLKNKEGMPQFYRRIKFTIRELPIINKQREFPKFFGGIKDKGLQKFLMRECENYGELTDVLIPAMKESERLGVDLTEDFVRMMIGRPDLTKARIQ